MLPRCVRLFCAASTCLSLSSPEPESFLSSARRICLSIKFARRELLAEKKSHTHSRRGCAWPLHGGPRPEESGASLPAAARCNASVARPAAAERRSARRTKLTARGPAREGVSRDQASRKAKSRQGCLPLRRLAPPLRSRERPPGCHVCSRVPAFGCPASDASVHHFMPCAQLQSDAGLGGWEARRTHTQRGRGFGGRQLGPCRLQLRSAVPLLLRSGGGARSDDDARQRARHRARGGAGAPACRRRRRRSAESERKKLQRRQSASRAIL
ncbi:hypothetical protein FA09DRAFT_2669 [Tilletiopsis washingtonensis]|jgi:hypothetical protein|uniref:Uncharacterized protein n=1 Tax=Tilletiopsis washingtonensis TaxID=58919 RepID=A0A316ZIK1_9BASI|nr:hypothetical protein FA09DRAFT_2669 [Tilletiopsis washingtonensis]PWO01127.1 hypothetical protein FA09DRAFT_2669 [Tilletiopsis washingtonensis]